PAKNVYPAPAHEFRRNPGADPARLGPLLLHQLGVEEILMHADPARAPGLRALVQALPANVRGHRNLQRQRSPQESQVLGQMDRPADTQSIQGKAHAGTGSSSLGSSSASARPTLRQYGEGPANPRSLSRPLPSRFKTGFCIDGLR